MISYESWRTKIRSYKPNFPHWSSYWRRLKISDSYEESDSNKNESFCSENDMVNEGLDDEIDENESQ